MGDQINNNAKRGTYRKSLQFYQINKAYCLIPDDNINRLCSGKPYLHLEEPLKLVLCRLDMVINQVIRPFGSFYALRIYAYPLPELWNLGLELNAS